MSTKHPWLFRIVGFLGVLVVADVTSGTLLLRYWTPFENPHGLRIFAYQHEMPRADVLILGTSKIRTAIMPDLIDETLSAGLRKPVSSYCLGQNASNAFTSWLVLKDAVAAHGPPEMIVLELSPGSLNANNRDVARDLRYYSSIAEIVTATRWIDSRDRLFAAAGGWFQGASSLALYGSRWLYRQDFENDLGRYRDRKGAQYPATASRRRRRLSDLGEERRRALLDEAVPYARDQFLAQYEAGGAPNAGFQAIVEFTGTRGIPLVLVDPPVRPEYRLAVIEPDEMLEFRRTIEHALLDPRSQVVEADLSGLELTADDFHDLTHLHPDGARKLSRHLAEEILLPLLLGKEEF